MLLTRCPWRRQAASKTNDTAGDGTTTATILSAAIIAEGMKIVAAGTNPVQLTRGIEKTVTALVKELQSLSVEVSDDDLANVATVSAGNNEVVRLPCALSRGSTAVRAVSGREQRYRAQPFIWSGGECSREVFILCKDSGWLCKVGIRMSGRGSHRRSGS